jgi:tRNA C32,U32 (ribose-2'-O)-methylase TrmJ
MTQAVTLIGDSIENPANALVMKDVAAMFGAACRFRDTKGLNQIEGSIGLGGEPFLTIETEQISGLHPRIVAFDNLPGASEVYGYQAGSDFAVMVGNERRGLSYECGKLATEKVHVPMFSRRINCLNVAAASAVALYYLCGTRVGRMAVRGEPGNRRPEVLLLGPGNHVEVGSAIRSIAGFGWNRVFIEDRKQVWFGCDRTVRSEGRAAARRGKNEILCIPCPVDASHAFSRVTVVTTRNTGTPVHRVNLARGPRQLIVIPDESCVDCAAEEWLRLGKEAEFAQLQVPVAEFPYHFRLSATIALAEVSRQLGRRPTTKAPPPLRPPIYDHRLASVADDVGEPIHLDNLIDY